METVVVPKEVWETAVALAMSAAGTHEGHGGTDPARWPEIWQDVVRFYAPDRAAALGIKDPHKFEAVPRVLHTTSQVFIRSLNEYCREFVNAIKDDKHVPPKYVFAPIDVDSLSPDALTLAQEHAFGPHEMHVVEGVLRACKDVAQTLASAPLVPVAAVSAGGYYNAQHPVQIVDGKPTVVLPNDETTSTTGA